MKGSIVATLGTCTLAVVGAVAGWFLFTEPASDAREVAGPSTRAVPVETALARSGAAATLIRATGTLKASDSVVVQPEIAGRVVEVLFEQGQAVTAGTPLVKLDDPDAPGGARPGQGRAVPGDARTTGARSRCRGVVRPRRRRWTRRGRRWRTAEAEVELARCPGRARDITAPFDGVVGLKEISVGRYVEPGDELVALERIDPLYLDFRLSERWLTKLAPGDVVAVTVDALPGERFEGTDRGARPAGRRQRPRGPAAGHGAQRGPRSCDRACSRASTSSSTSGRMPCWCPRPPSSCRRRARSSTGSRRAGRWRRTVDDRRAPRRHGRDHRGPRRRRYRGRQRPCPPARPGAGRGRPAGRARAEPG